MHLPVNRTRKFLISFAVIGLIMWVSGHLLRPRSFMYQPGEGKSAEAAPPVVAAKTPPAPQRRPIPAARPAPQPEPGTAPFKELGWKGSRYTMGGEPFTGISTEMGKSGLLTKRYELKNGVLHGLMEEWYPSGVQRARTEFTDGRHHGDNVYWNEDGSLQVRKVWENDKLLSEDKP